MTKSKNSKVLASFTKYCLKHPEQRFWQALSNWGDFNAIYVTKNGQTKDTFYCEDKDK